MPANGNYFRRFCRGVISKTTCRCDGVVVYLCGPGRNFQGDDGKMAFECVAGVCLCNSLSVVNKLSIFQRCLFARNFKNLCVCSCGILTSNEVFDF